MLSITRPITAAAIDGLANLAPNHPVYLLTGHHDDKIVVKYENSTRTNLIRNARVIGAVDRRAQGYSVTATELQEMNNWANAALNGADQQTTAILNDFLSWGQGSGTWMKMDVYQLVDLRQAVEHLAAHDKSDVRTMARILNAPAGMEKLGAIVAADMFNGNQDRFSITYPLSNEAEGLGLTDDTLSFLTTKTRLNHLLNWGNILVACGPNARPIGLDSFDPGSKFNDWNRQLDQAEQHAGEQWPGRFLASNKAADRLTVTRRCVEDLNIMLGRRNRKLPLVSRLRLNKNAADRMAHGMDVRIAQIKNRLVTAYRGRTNKPVGLTDRAAILG